MELVEADSGVVEGLFDDVASAGAGFAEEEWLWGEFFEGDEGAAGPGMGAGDGEEELVVEEVLDGDFLVGGGTLDEAEVGFGGEDPGGDLLGVAAFDGELKAGIVAEECAEDAGEQVLGDGGGGGDAEGSAGLSLQGGEGVEGFL